MVWARVSARDSYSLPEIIDPELTDNTIHVYAAILQCTGDFGESPSYQQLQHACQISAPTVRKAITILKRKGLITAPKFQVRAIKPTDPERVLRNRPPDPWDELKPPKKYFRKG